jgi:hypothetical protein
MAAQISPHGVIDLGFSNLKQRSEAVMSEGLLNFLNSVVAVGGGGAIIALALIKFFGEKWVDKKLTGDLQKVRHDQNREIENLRADQNREIQNLRAEVDSRLSGTLKLQGKEFETLPVAWGKLHAAYSLLANLVNPLQRVPNIDGMTDPQLVEFLRGTKLLETQQAEILEGERKLEMFQEMIFWHRLHEVRLAWNDCAKFIIHNKIFFPPDIGDKFTEITGQMVSAISDCQHGHAENDVESSEKAYTTVTEEIRPLLDNISETIRERLRSHGKDQ